MLPVTKKDLIRFTPERENAPTYLIGVPSIAGRAKFNRRMVEEGAGYMSDDELLDIVKDGVKEVVVDHQQEEILALIDEYKALPPEERPVELSRKIAAIEKQIHPLYAPYAAASASRSYHMEILPIIAAKCFLRGIENGVEYEAKAGMLTDECLELIPEDDVRAIGWKVLLTPSQEQRKNSESPSQSTASQPTSTAAE